MTPYQSELGGGGGGDGGDGDGIAEELAQEQRAISIAEFFEKNKHMLGFDSGARGLVTAVKEACDNSLTWSTPFVYRRTGETRHAPIGSVIDDLVESNPSAVETKRDGDLQKLRVDDFEALSFGEGYEVDFRRVSSVFRHRVNSDIFRVTVEGGREVELTDYHSVFVLRDGDVVSVETSDLTHEDYVVLPDTSWSSRPAHSIDLVAELLQLDEHLTEPVGLYGVEQLIERYREEIVAATDRQQPLSDFRKCDRLPLAVVRELDLDREEYADCSLGVRYGRHRIPAILPVTDGLAELLGLYVAEGCVTGTDGARKKAYFSLGAHEKELIEYAVDLVESVFGIVPSVADAHDTATNVGVGSKIVALVLSEVFRAGTEAGEKRVPRFVFDFPEYKRERFFLGYAAGDGHPTESVIPVLRDHGGIDRVEVNKLTLATTSERLASGLRYLLSSVDYDATYERKPPESRVVDGREAEFSESHVLYVRPDQSSVSKRSLPADELLTEVDDAKLAYNLDGRQTRVDSEHAIALADGGDVTFAGAGRRIAEGDLSALPITDIERIDYDREWVYDVSVPGDENFMAGTSPLACHNSLDATEEAGILPDIYVEIVDEGDYYRLVVEDNGPGITKEQVPKIFGKLLYGSRFGKREQSLAPDQQLLVRRNGTTEFVPIGVLCDAFLPHEGPGTAPVPDGIEVPSFNRDTHEVTWEPVTHAIRHETDEPTYEITTQRGRTVEVTGNHSLFGVTKDGETKELKAADLSPGDTILSPQKLPSTDETVDQVNLLEHLRPDQLEDRRVYVYGFDEETIGKLREAETVRKKPNPDSSRERYYYRYDGVDILRDSLETNYIEKGYLPAETVLELGWEGRAAGCELKTYQVGGEETTVPVNVPVDESFVELLGYYISEGHAGPRQIGLTFGSHETELIERTEQAIEGLSGSTTTVVRERSSTRVKGFGSPLALFFKNVCGDAAAEKRIPEFVFDMSPEYQQRFIAALYEGDGSDAYPGNELSHTTTSETLARQLSVLWNMQGVLASTEIKEDASGYADEGTTRYRTKVFGDDVDIAGVFEQSGPSSGQAYKRVPTSLLDEVRAGPTDRTTVPDTVPGLLMAAGVGSTAEHAAEYASLIRDAFDGTTLPSSRYVRYLREMGLINDEDQPTARLEELWSTVQSLHGITESDMCLLPVKEVRETEPPEYVYDISVPGATGRDENFVVANEGALSVKNSRGQQGIGISAAVLYAQLTSGKPARITSKTQGGDAEYFELIVDTDTNEPEISVEETTTWERPHGTRIEIELEGNMRARTQLHDYIEHTAVVNPHARIELREPGLDEPLKFERATDQLPDETEEIKPHPHGVELGTLKKMLEATDSYSISGFLQGEFTRVGATTAENVVDAFRDRQFGRELAWRAPGATDEADVEAAVTEATANKGAEATAAFAAGVSDRLDEQGTVAYGDIERAVTAAAEAAEDEYDTRFGGTVREKATAAAWDAVTTTREAECFRLVDEATTTRKDDAAVDALARRIATRFADSELDEPGKGDGARDRVTRDTLAEWVDWAAERTADREGETFGETAREKVVDAFWERGRTVETDPPKVREVAGDRDTIARLLEAMRETDILSPPTDCLAPITRDLVEAGLRKEYDADFYAACTRDAEVHGGDPFIVEAGIAYGGELESEGTVDVLRFANRVPLVYQRGACATVDVIKDINWRNYNLDQPGGSGIPNGPAVLMVHVASTNVPFTSESKDAVANVREIEDEIELALREAARELKSYLNRQRSLKERRQKRDTLAEILPEMAEKLSEVTDREPLAIDDSLARIMNNVLVERRRENGHVKLAVENNDDAGTELEITDICSVDPGDVAGASVVEMDGEWFVRWEPTVDAGETAELVYDVPADADFEVAVEGIAEEKLTTNT